MNVDPKNLVSRSKGFTLTEILVVLTIVVVLAFLGMAFGRRALDSARSAKCVSNLRDIGAASLAYVSDNNGFLPPICQLTYGQAWSVPAVNRWWPSFLTGSTSRSSELVFSTWRCPEVRDDDFQVEPSGIVYSSYTPLRPIISFIDVNNPTGGMRLSSVRNPEKVWMFGDGGRPVANTEGIVERYETVGAMQRFGNSWASSARPVCRHNGGKHSHYVACDGHVETLTRDQINNIDNGAFGKHNGSKVEY